jgi:hypothetical protein
MPMGEVPLYGASFAQAAVRESAAISVDQYNLTRVADDILLMNQLGTKAYRLSLAWSRIFPSGCASDAGAGRTHYDDRFKYGGTCLSDETLGSFGGRVPGDWRGVVRERWLVPAGQARGRDRDSNLR